MPRIQAPLPCVPSPSSDTWGSSLTASSSSRSMHGSTRPGRSCRCMPWACLAILSGVSSPTRSVFCTGRVWCQSFYFYFYFFRSTIYNAGLTRSPRVAHTNTEYSMTTLCSDHYVLPKPRSLLLVGDHEHKAHGLFQDNVALLSGEKVETPQHGSAHTVASHWIALGRSPDRNPTQRSGQLPEGINSP
jgi:hypothetical protein